MKKQNKVINVVKELVEYNFSANDHTTFTLDIKRKLLLVYVDGIEIKTDMTVDTLTRLKDLCTLGLGEIR